MYLIYNVINFYSILPEIKTKYHFFKVNLGIVIMYTITDGNRFARFDYLKVLFSY